MASWAFERRCDRIPRSRSTCTPGVLIRFTAPELKIRGSNALMTNRNTEDDDGISEILTNQRPVSETFFTFSADQTISQNIQSDEASKWIRQISEKKMPEVQPGFALTSRHTVMIPM